ncbi:uncharacterized protein BKCO1_1600023 [Diplodia corticola]|uniref:Uncharacterized protein n=1 Tax=Diplodia corticola TaxID=236234 RepID=A0A1J9S6G6_9PEZI|nr:uncharacterized protein BKCO1_1600023 [Diplodia corticola]OJD35540.1 hypothetical protein BKCO1_1600023 [Diplodia corticola]
MPPTPSIILTPASSSSPEQARNVPLLNPHTTTARRPSTENITNQYRNRYALYLAAQFNISAAAAFVEIDEQIRFNQSRKSSAVSEADVRDVRTGGGF